jgi:outer membrane immunogenic protein
MLATAAAAAALLAGAYTARADGMPPAPAAYKPPSSWTGFYVGFESGWDWDSVEFRSFTNTRLHSTWDRDVVNAGIFVGYQYQWRSLVLGVEANLIGNEFDDSHDDAVRGSFGTCASGVGARLWNCVGKITDVVTVGPRLGWVIHDFMPYATGGYAFGNFDNKKICGATGLNCFNPTLPRGPENVLPAGTAVELSQASSDGWFVGGGLEYKVADHVVVGIDYRHVDLGSVNVAFFDPQHGNFIDNERVRGTSDMVMLRGSLLFGARDIVAPLK